MTTRVYDYVMIKREGGHPGYTSYVIVGSASHLRGLFHELLDGISRFEHANPEEPHGVLSLEVGDASGRYDYVTLQLRVGSSSGASVRRKRAFWRFYDSRIAAPLVALVMLGFVMLGVRDVFMWLFG